MISILIVEDEVIPANYLKKILTEEGFCVMGIVDRGQDAIRVAKKEKPDIIFMDVMLKDSLSGCEAALQIKRVQPDIEIIFLTAYSDQEMIEFAVDSNAAGYLLKPYREKEILATLQLVIAKIDTAPVVVEEKVNKLTLTDRYEYWFDKKMLMRNGVEVNCGPKAQVLIDLLCQNRGSTVHIDEIMEVLWGDKHKSLQALRSLVHRIRQMTTGSLIVNTNKLGYKILLEE